MGTQVGPKVLLPCSGLQQDHSTPGVTTSSTGIHADSLQQISRVRFFMVMLSSHRSSDVSPELRMPRNTTKSLRFPASSQCTCSCRRQQSHSPHPQNPNPHGVMQPTQSEGLNRDITSCWEHLEARTPSARVAEPRGKKCETSLCDAGVVCSGGKSIF